MSTDKKMDGYAIHMLATVGISIRNPIIVPPKYDGSQIKYNNHTQAKPVSHGLNVPFFAATGIPLFD